MIVMKFGGTSVRNAEAMLNVADIIERELWRKPIVVVSACAGVTNTLQLILDHAFRGEFEDASEKLNQLSDFHSEIADSLRVGQVDLHDQLKKLFTSVKHHLLLLRGRKFDGRRVSDAVLGVGELASSLILHVLLQNRGLETALVDARELIITDERYTKAAPDPQETQVSCVTKLMPKISSHQVVVTQGFIAATPKGVSTTIGRGGSDYSATLIGAALQVNEIQIWTDTDGIMTTDPALISGAHLIETISFEEAAEMAHFGAKVLHPNTIEPAKLAGIPIRVLNSFNSELNGTAVGFPTDNSEANAPVPKGIAFKKDVTIVALKSTHLTKPYEFLASVFGILADSRKSVGLVTTSSAGVSFVVDDKDDLSGIILKLRPFSSIELIEKRAVIAVIGRFYRNSEEVATRVFSVLTELNVRVDLVSFGGSEINLALAIDSDRLQDAVRAIHATFFESDLREDDLKLASDDDKCQLECRAENLAI